MYVSRIPSWRRNVRTSRGVQHIFEYLDSRSTASRRHHHVSSDPRSGSSQCLAISLSHHSAYKKDVRSRGTSKNGNQHQHCLQCLLTVRCQYILWFRYRQFPPLITKCIQRTGRINTTLDHPSGFVASLIIVVEQPVKQQQGAPLPFQSAADSREAHSCPPCLWQWQGAGVAWHREDRRN